MESNPFWQRAIEPEQISRLASMDLCDPETGESYWSRFLNPLEEPGLDVARLVNAAILKCEATYGEGILIPFTPSDDREGGFARLDVDWLFSMDRVRVGGESCVVEEPSEEWGDGWRFQTIMDKPYCVGAVGPLETGPEEHALVALDIVRWLFLELDDQFMRTLHHSVGIMHTFTGGKATYLNANILIAGMEFGALLLYVFWDQMTRDERLITMTLGNTYSDVVKRRRKDANGRVAARLVTAYATPEPYRVKTWIQLIQYLAPVASIPQAHTAFQAPLEGWDDKFTGLYNSPAFAILKYLLKSEAREKALQRTAFNGNGVVFSTLYVLIMGGDDTMQPLGYTDEMMQEMNPRTMIYLMSGNLTGQQALDWSRAGFVFVDEIQKYLEHGITDPMEAKSIEDTPDSWLGEWE